MADLRELRSGTVVYVDDAGLAHPFSCSWLVQVASGNPEPDSIEDTYLLVDCGAPVRRHPDYPDAELGQALTCDVGHDRLSMELAQAPRGPEWAREQLERAGWAS